MTYGYIRVSTDKQTVENQRFEINAFCKRQNLAIDGWIEETISGTKNYDKRKLGNLLKTVKKDDLIICAELSRLGRNLFMIMEILHICMNKECKVWTIKDNYRLGDNIQSKVLAFAFGQTLFRYQMMVSFSINCYGRFRNKTIEYFSGMSSIFSWFLSLCPCIHS